MPQNVFKIIICIAFQAVFDNKGYAVTMEKEEKTAVKMWLFLWKLIPFIASPFL